jgi:RNA polymerase sigma factor (sigma-70 family)
VTVLSSHAEGQLFTPISEPHQAQTRYAVVLAVCSVLISVPFPDSSGEGGNQDHPGGWTTGGAGLRSNSSVKLRPMGSRDPDWPAVMDRLVRGESAAFLELSRLITSFLVQWRAYDFRDEWDDLIQEVVMAAIEATRARRLRKPGAIVAYVRTATRYKFVDCLRRRRGEPLEDEEGEERPADLRWPPVPDRDPGSFEILDQVDKLLENQRKCIVSVYVEGNTYSEAAAATGIPLGSLKRHLREGLATLRAGLADFRDRGDPISPPDPTYIDRSGSSAPGISGGRRNRP